MYHIHGLGDSTLQTGQIPQINLKFNAILMKISVRTFTHSVPHVALIIPSKENESEKQILINGDPVIISMSWNVRGKRVVILPISHQ